MIRFGVANSPFHWGYFAVHVQLSLRYLQDGKQFITIEPTRIHTRDGRTYNGNLRYTIRPIEDAINYFHERQRLQH